MQKIFLMIVVVAIPVLLLDCTSNTIPQSATPLITSYPVLASASTTTPSGMTSASVTPGSTPPSPIDITPPSKEFLADHNYELPGIPRVTCEGLKQMIDRGDSFVLVDVRYPSIYQLKHLPGAINIPFFPMPSLTQAQIDNLLLGLPKDKLSIFYCACPGDEESAGAADKLIKMDAGYNAANVKVMWKGFWKWIELGYPVLQ